MRDHHLALLSVACLGASALLYAGAAAGAPPTAREESTTVEYHADFPAYASVQELHDHADVVVQATGTARVRTAELLPVEPADPADPRQNPSLGAAPAAADAPSTPPVVVTLRTLEVTGVVKGDLRVGDRIEVQELGGSYRGVTYVDSEGRAPLGTGQYLLFLARGATAFEPLNPEQGRLVLQRVGYVPFAADPSALPVAEIAGYLTDHGVRTTS